MRTKKPLVLVCLGTLIVAVVVRVIVSSGYGTRLELPDIEDLACIEMGQVIEYEWAGGAVIDNRGDIAALYALLSRARKSTFTWYSAIHDSPGRPDYLAISIWVSAERGGARLYLYNYGDRGEIYVPYVGIYRINNKTREEIYRLYALAAIP